MLFTWRWQAGARDVPDRPPDLPAVVLLHDRWDDFGFQTTFELFFFDNTGESQHVGTVKILQRDQSLAKPPEQFEQLPENFCSLGQSLEYYENLLSLGLETANEICLALNDVVAMPPLADTWRSVDGFGVSLLRMSEASKAFQEAGQFFGHSVPIDPDAFVFSFRCYLDGFSDPHRVEFDFRADSALPHRTVAFVGKNGAGKSGVLAKLAEALSGWKPNAGIFDPGRPAFSRTICCSYAVFQPFQVPTLRSSSYRYCGLRNLDGNIDNDALWKRLHESIADIHRAKRTEKWLQLVGIEDVLGSDVDRSFLESEGEALDARLRILSTGQVIVLALFTDLLANVERQALFLCDEPESYLHPTLLSTFLRLMHNVLDEYDSYSIIATHSPIVVQEVPSRCVRVFEREGTVPVQAAIGAESFGDNLTELVDRVFRMNDDDKNYKSIMRALAAAYDDDEIEAMFGAGLSLNARLFLKSLRPPAG